MSSAQSPVDIPLQPISSPTQAGETTESHGNVRTEDVPSTAQRPGSSCSKNTEESNAISKRSKKSRRCSTPPAGHQASAPLSDQRDSGSSAGDRYSPPAVNVTMPQDTPTLLAESDVPSLGEPLQPFVTARTGSLNGPREDDTASQHDQDLGSTPPSEVQSAHARGDDNGPIREAQETNEEQERMRFPDQSDLMKALTKEFTTDAYTEEEKTEAWNKASETVMNYSDEMVEHWNKEIDGLLTFGGLFSAILTAFSVLSYPLLQPAPTDQTNAILERMSAQLESFRLAPPFVNSTVTAFNASQLPFKPPVYAIWLNTLWFTSLVFSLASATIGIIVKQWLKEYSTGLYGASRDIARRRQDRYNKLQKWQVATIVAVIPVLLLIAAVLFLAGLLVFLHNVNPTVAGVVSIFVGLLLVFITSTTVLPGFSRSCCYYSPQARAFFPVVRPAALIVKITLLLLVLILTFLSSWIGILARPLKRLSLFLLNLFGEINEGWLLPRIWLGREMSTESEAATLDASILVTAYSATLDVFALENSIVALSESTDFVVWHEYTSKLEEAATIRCGSRDRWPKHVLNHFSWTVGIMLLLLEADLRLCPGGEHEQIRHGAQKFIPEFPLALRRYGERVAKTDRETRLWAMKTLFCMALSDVEPMFPHQHHLDIHDPVTRKIAIVAAAHQLRTFVKYPRCLASPRLQRNDVGWELRHVILPPLRIIEQLRDHHAVSGALAGIEPLAAAQDALGSIHTFLLGMDWNSAQRDLDLERVSYMHILESIVNIHRNEHTRDLITPTFVKALTSAFLRLIGEDEWEHIISTDGYVGECRDILVQLCSTVRIKSSSS